MYIEYNVNPAEKKVGDCVIRALTKALGMTWEEVYLALCLQGYKMYDMPSSNAVWGAFLRSKGFKRGIISDSCPDCYTIDDFCKEFPQGIYIIGTGSHAVTAIDGNVYDSWDSTQETPLYYYYKGGDVNAV